MPLVTDSFAAAGTFMVTAGSGLQSYNELKHYKEVARKLGLPEAADSAIAITELVMASIPNPILILLNLPKLFAASKRYYRALGAIGKAPLTDLEKSDEKTLAQKAIYWAFIMMGSFVIFVGTVIGIVLDLTGHG